ncbi:MAG TPA: hypothetical protein PKL46_14290 [Aquabacterium sp.]|nr:hypothetical protein [Aquabacterium sp.]
MPAAATPAALRPACHSLRGACAVVGAAALQQQLLHLEHAAHDGADRAALQPAQQSVAGALGALVADLAQALEGDT